MTNIIALNQGLINSNSTVKNIIANNRDADMLFKFSTTGYFATSTQLGLMPRHGINNLPFSNHAVDLLDIKMPGYSANFSKSWAEITDRRSIELKSQSLASQRRIVVQWSGGIDSTCIVVSILKNFNKDEREQVLIACNWGSIVENPRFYYDYIVPNFQTVDINQFTQSYRNNYDQYIVINGMPGDVILQSVAGLDLGLHFVDPTLLRKPWKSSPDRLIDYLQTSFECKELGMWFYEKLSDNINSVDVPIETYFDFLWWGGFNYHWTSQIFFEWFANFADGNVSWHNHRNSFVNWYETVDYQLWSMVNNNQEKYGTNLGDFKKASKKYIYEYNRDEWYYKYKLKMGSPGRNQQNARTLGAFAITDEFKILYLDQDFEDICEMLPRYLKNT